MAPAGEPSGGAAPLVTVVVATYNSAATLACALASVQRQTFRDLEVWVIGDACTDDSEAVVAAAADPRIRWANLARNSGSQAGPNNEGQRRARGRYLAYLGHDDLWFPWHLDTLVDAALREQAGMAHGLGIALGPDGAVEASGPPPRGGTYRGHFLPPTNWLVDRTVIERLGGWRPPDALGRPVDADILDRIAASGASIACASRLTTIKFPSPWWRSYAPDAARPQMAMSAELAADPVGLSTRLLCQIAAEHARTTFPTPVVSLAWGRVGAALRRALGASLRRVEGVPGVEAALRWRFQRARRRLRARRGLVS